ncbi:MAG: FtsX-like permease family protein [Chloroflexi bacterium]|nr:FtsX-like permease family protein [Chloroflexota bacterium]
MKAIGATDRDVMTIFLTEAALVGFSGGVAGVGLSLFVQNVVNTALANVPQDQGGITFLPIDPSQIQGNLFVIPSELILFAVTLATLVGIGAGLFPGPARGTPAARAGAQVRVRITAGGLSENL